VWAADRGRVLGLPGGAPGGELEEREDPGVPIWRGVEGGLALNALYCIVLYCAVSDCVLLSSNSEHLGAPPTQSLL
jgi:hypothetical protein